LGDTVGRNIVEYLPSVSGGIFTRIYTKVGARFGAERALGIIGDSAVALLVALGAVLVWRRGGRLPVGFVPLYSLLILAWGFQHPRFLLPVLPLMHAFFFVSLWAILAWLGGAGCPGLRSVRSRSLVLALVAGATILSRLQRAPENFEKLAGAPAAAEQAGLAALADAVRTKTPPDAIVASTMSDTVGLLTGRKGVSVPDSGETLAEFLRRTAATHVLGERTHGSWSAVSSCVSEGAGPARVLYEADPFVLWELSR
jgi:hypothetical protein